MKTLISTSGGKDSQALAHMIMREHGEKNFKFQPELLYIHHQTRSKESHQKDIDAIKANVPFKLHIRQVSKKYTQNIEANLRDERYRIYEEFRGYKILQGHHLNDSFEWFLMQQLRSSESPKPIMPERGNISRPLIHMSREEIDQYVQKYNIPYHEDESNLDSRFDRNYLRNEVIPLIKKRFPKYLENFKTQNAPSVKVDNHVFKQKNYHIIDIGSELNLDIVRNSIKTFSNKQRGSLREQLEKLEIAISNKSQGPLVFSGGVNIYVLFDSLLITSKTLNPDQVEIDSSNQVDPSLLTVGQAIDQKLIAIAGEVPKRLTGKVQSLSRDHNIYYKPKVIDFLKHNQKFNKSNLVLRNISLIID